LDAGAGCGSDAGAGCGSDAGAGCGSDAGAGCGLDAGADCGSDAGAGCFPLTYPFKFSIFSMFSLSTLNFGGEINVKVQTKEKVPFF